MNETLKTIIKGVSPVLGGLVGGPIGASVVAMLGNILLGDDKASETELAMAVANPNNLLKIKEIEASITMAQLASDDKDKDRQTKINEIEASSESFFKSGARPMALWLSVIGWGYNFILVPICNSMGIPAVGIGTAEITWLLGGLLGLGAFRSFDKLKGGK